MTAALIAIAAMWLAGLPVAVALEPSLGWRARTGLGFLLGAGMASLILLGATIVGVPWSRAVVFVPLALASAAFLPAALRVERRAERLPRPRLALAADAATAISVAGYALLATVARPWDWDFWAIWGLKAKEHFLARGLSFEFLANPDNIFAHPDYPPLVSLLYDVAAIVGGRWDDRWLGTFSIAFAAALLLVLREELERQLESPVVAALGTLALTGAACSPWIGLGEGPLVALSASGLVLVSRGLRTDAPRAIVTGSLLVGFGALAKNEGMSMVLAMVVASLLVRRQRWAHVALPAGIVMAPWLLVRYFTATTTKLFEGSLLSRAAERLADPGTFLATFVGGGLERLELWIALAIVLALVPALGRRERFLLSTIFLQCLAIAAVYAGTPYDFVWHVNSSLSRVTSQLAPLVGVLCVLGIGQLIGADAAKQSKQEDENEQAS
ncbi:MAG: hypothetical protein NDJ92_02185 [Thermoanaerobaculia bacterium]|nr:hypothetical protein [Thermoanaerobaculia bacterium]